eukprot:350733-Chlamydomonas_euryale.AAC.3
MLADAGRRRPPGDTRKRHHHPLPAGGCGGVGGLCLFSALHRIQIVTTLAPHARSSAKAPML